MGILVDHFKRVVMNGHRLFGFDELYGVKGVIGPHGKIIADRQNCQIDTFFADEFHVVEQTRITGVVEVFSIDGEKKTAGRAGVDDASRIDDCRAVVDDDSFSLAVGGQLVGCDDGSTRSPGDGDGVSFVVAFNLEEGVAVVTLLAWVPSGDGFL